MSSVQTKAQPKARRTEAPAPNPPSGRNKLVAVAASNGKSKEPTAFGKRLRDLRSKRSISQAELARNAGVSAGYVGLIETGERGERPSLDIVKKFAQALSANVSELESLMRTSGHLGEHETLADAEQPTVEGVIERDRFLSKTQKALLVGMYQDMRRRPTS